MLRPLNTSNSTSDWITIILLAKQWLFDDIAANARDLLSQVQMKASEKIMICFDSRLGIDKKWAREPLIQVITRSRILNRPETNRIGIKLACSINYMRENIAANRGNSWDAERAVDRMLDRWNIDEDASLDEDVELVSC